MKKIIIASFTILVVVITACGGRESTQAEQDKQEKTVQEQVDKDQKSMDSLEKAIRSQIDAVSDDSLMNVSH